LLKGGGYRFAAGTYDRFARRTFGRTVLKLRVGGITVVTAARDLPDSHRGNNDNE
jgi:hypothetical protein